MTKFQPDEAIFHPEEIFFSRTDPRGVIESCNDVFQRISHYPWERLVGAPHKLIRHADMPKGVFWLLWNYIQAGKPIGAYVKNLSADGKYYWVYALVTPIETGYLSIRIKPTSPLLETVSDLYGQLLAQEKSQNLSPQKSAELLTDHLKEMGFKTYSDFMTHAVDVETQSRSHVLGQKKTNFSHHFSSMVKALTDVKTLGGQIVSDFESIKTTPLNMRIQAAHLGERASSLSVISSNYQILASQIKEIIEEFMQSAEAVLKTVKEGLFLSCISGFQSESINAFAVETNLPDFIDREAEIALLTHQNAKYNKQALEGFARISKEINHFTELSVSLKRILSGLSLTRILCEMESKRIGHDARNMSDIAAQLSDFQNSTGRCLKEIEEQNLQLQNALKGQTATTKKTTSQTAITRFAAA